MASIGERCSVLLDRLSQVGCAIQERLPCKYVLGDWMAANGPTRNIFVYVAPVHASLQFYSSLQPPGPKPPPLPRFSPLRSSATSLEPHGRKSPATALDRNTPLSSSPNHDSHENNTRRRITDKGTQYTSFVRPISNLGLSVFCCRIKYVKRQHLL